MNRRFILIEQGNTDKGDHYADITLPGRAGQDIILECESNLDPFMAIFDEPSREPLPQATFEDVTSAGRKGLLSIIPIIGGVGAELVGLLGSPLAQRRDVWWEDLEWRLRDLEGRVEGFRFDDLSQNKQFVSQALQAGVAALRSHQTEKLEALRNAVLNVAIGNAPSGVLHNDFSKLCR